MFPDRAASRFACGSVLQICGGRRPERSPEGRNIRQVAIHLIVVQAIADNEPVGDIETDVVGTGGKLAAARFGQERTKPQGSRVALGQPSEQKGRGAARVDDVLYQNDILSLDVILQVLVQRQRPHRRRGSAVAGNRQEIDGQGKGQLPDQVGMEYRSSLEDADKVRFPAPVIGFDSAGHFRDTLPDLGLVYENIQSLCPALRHGLIIAQARSALRR